MTEPRRDASPWGSTDAGTSWWPSVLGAILLVWSWWESSGSAVLDDQTGWGVVAILGVGMSALGLVTWLRAGRRAVSLRRERVLGQAEAFAAARVGVAHVVSLEPATVAGDGLISYAGSARYHRPSCLLARGKATTPWAPSAGSQPCEMCRP